MHKEDTLAVHYKGKNINDVLEMPISEAYEFFKPIPAIARKLKALVDVGLGYVHLGQSAVTLSGGESQRMKLAAELFRKATGNTLYIYGHDGFAGELGHTTLVRHNGRLCNCGKNGCLEAYCSAIGIARTAREWLDMTDEPSLLRKLDKITAKDIYDAAKEGDQLSLKLFDYTGTMLGMAFADFIEFSSPEAIVLFGGMAKSKEFLTEPIERAMNANVLPTDISSLRNLHVSRSVIRKNASLPNSKASFRM